LVSSTADTGTNQIGFGVGGDPHGPGPEGFVAKEVGGEAIASGALSRFGAGALDALKDTRTLGQKFVEGAAEGLGQLAVGGAGIVTGVLLNVAVSAHPPAQSSAATTQSKPTPTPQAKP
jgi:hypothetical protein